jgi:hypothetical protein
VKEKVEAFRKRDIKFNDRLQSQIKQEVIGLQFNLRSNGKQLLSVLKQPVDSSSVMKYKSVGDFLNPILMDIDPE